MQGYDVQQSTTAYPLVFLMVLTSDHISPATGLTPTVTISKNGGSFASPSGAVSEIANGWYKVAGNATDTAMLGPVILHATGSGADPTDALFPVVAYNPQTTSLGLSLAKTTNITGFNDIAATAIVSSGAITTSSGAVSTVTTVTNQLTGAAIATAILTDTTSGDFATTGSPGHILVTQLGGAFTSTSSVFTTASLVNAPSGSGGGISLSTTMNSPRALDSIADGSFTVNDALWSAVGAGVGIKDASSGTSLIVKTPSTATVLRTYTITTAAIPTTVPTKIA